MKIFETNRLYTRKSDHKNDNDVRLLLEMHNNGEIMKYVGFPNGLQVNFEKEKEATERKPRLLTYTKGVNEFIGYCSTGTINKEGFWGIDIKLKPEFWNKGYGYELLSGLIDYIFYELKSGNGIQVDPNLENIAAVKMYEKLGFEKTNIVNHFKTEQMEFSTNVYIINNKKT